MSEEKVSKDNPLPLYHQLKEILSKKIKDEVLEPGDPIPTERELVDVHGISRMTARKAVMALVNEGLLYREQGRGTFVAEPEPKMKHELSELTGFTEEMKEKGLETKTEIVDFDLEIASNDIRKHLELPTEIEQVIKVKRLRYVEKEPFSLETVWIPYDLVPDLTEEVLTGASLYEIFRKKYGHQLEEARQTVEPIMVTENEGELLTISSKALALLFRRTTYLKEERIIEYTKAIYRSDNFEHEVILK
ncbi:GntR family transcriptional regulator [Halanaerobacter jeridensis]|uniref:GntR family transcriptional regulator n=1 Tax=Halanaerobacter jeridensis TaxID=706427 RepID=A0A938XUM1_9FIRM|nr:GntR family transcriptional regulator [Halanaerobacter jeridensis]MBM7558209.1 GntR family transcriptional regulator [Halanaerobacter jeridensis]